MTFSTPAIIVKYIPRARAESNSKLRAKSKGKYSKIGIHVSGGNVLQVTKVNVELVYALCQNTVVIKSLAVEAAQHTWNHHVVSLRVGKLSGEDLV